MNAIDRPPSAPAAGKSSQPLSRRFILGSVVFGVGFCVPALIPVVLASGFPAAWKAALSGGLAFGIPELAMVVAVAIMGREGFHYLKKLVWCLFKQAAPPDRVSRTRHQIGLAMFGGPILLAWLGPYVEYASGSGVRQPIWLLVGGDLVFISSFLVLGGAFWGKVRALFVLEPQESC